MTKKEKIAWEEIRDELVKAYLILGGEAPPEEHRTLAWREGMSVEALARDVARYAGIMQRDHGRWVAQCKKQTVELERLHMAKRRLQEVPAVLMEGLREFRFGIGNCLQGLKIVAGVVTGKPVQLSQWPEMPFMHYFRPRK